ncbi:MAG: RNA-binding cell elongation regulator Jag/EloR [Eubacteriales bacterium]|nr:RNA-binding cell elongation regulator Jag/EloR [Eubacteriales bacterium]
MTNFIEKKASTSEEAIRLALEELKLDRDSVSVEVLEVGKKGFFGIGAVPARVRVTYEVAEEKTVNETKPSAAPAKEEAVSVASAAAGDPAQAAKAFIDGLLEKMGIQGEAFPTMSEENTLLVDIRGEDMGAVIGRRGDTLDAIQYLTSLSINRGREEHIRVTLDTEGYRAKREESLKRLARKMAGKVLKYHKNMTLEPMNPYERRIIHAALQDYNGVTTYSTGTEPNRRVVVALERSYGRGGRSGRPQRSSRRYYNDEKRESGE